MCGYDWEKEDLFDPSTGIILLPGYGGENCPGNGLIENYECCCNECNYLLFCFPQVGTDSSQIFKRKSC